MPNYRLRVLVGPSLTQQVPITPNDDECPGEVRGDQFEGQVWVRIRNCEAFSASTAASGPGPESESSSDTTTPLAPKNADYFKNASKMTFSIVIRGRFRQLLASDNLVFGNVFDAPIRLPPGAGLGVRMMRMLVDPGLEADLNAAKPWAWSPVLCTMNSIAVRELSPEDGTGLPSLDKSDYDVTRPLPERNSLLFNDGMPRSASERRTYFALSANRQMVQLSPDYEYTMEFCNGLIDFNTLGLRLPGWGSISLLSFWDGQPLTYVMRTRDGATTLLVITFELVEIDEHKK
ncbi:hypothetical protein BDF22DRAFT_615749 [Syncephalis plumigaleata]|nr:hypothetical protein BDF22DRAFT_615749 [Syncephalis plumigaleata]